MPHHLWRGDLSPFGGEAVVDQVNAVCLEEQGAWVYDGFAAERG